MFHSFRLLPGIAGAALVAGGAFLIHTLPGLHVLSPVFMGGLIGLLIRNIIGVADVFRPGMVFSMRTLLRLGIVLLGVQLEIAQVKTIGMSGVVILTLTLAATFLFTVWFGRRLGVSEELSLLVASGTSICGVSAILAANTVIRGRDEDVAYAVAGITLFGTFFMIVYPFLAGVIVENSPQVFGLWAGASIHEIAQVTAAAFQVNQQTGEFGVIAKLTRVALLIPTVFVLVWWINRRLVACGDSSRQATFTVPWFLIGFIVLVCVNSAGIIPGSVKPPVVQLTSFLLALALAAMGMETDIRKIVEKGLRPLMLGACASLFVALFSAGLIVFRAMI